MTTTEGENDIQTAGQAQGNVVIGEDGTDSTTSEEISTTAQPITTEQTLPVMTDGNPTYYTIQYGDSLGSIALENYGNIQYAEDIAAANNMGVDDRIYEGQKIILPSITPR